MGQRVSHYASSAIVNSRGRLSLRAHNRFPVYVPELQSLNSIKYDNINYGKYRLLLNGRITFGPQPHLFFITGFFFFILLLILSLQIDDINKIGGEVVVIIGFILHMSSLLLFFIVSLSDPGVIPRDYRLRELIYDTTDFRRRNPNANFIRFCDKCQALRPPQSHHCSKCNICIRDQEFHLFAGGTCVGQRTARSSLLLTFTLGILGTYLIAVNSLIISTQKPDDKTLNKVVTYISLIFGVFMMFLPQLGIVLFIFRLYFIANGLTTRSYLNKMLDRRHWDAPLEKMTVFQNIRLFFFAKKAHSLFRERKSTMASDAEDIHENMATWDHVFTAPQDRYILSNILNTVDFPSPPNMPVTIHPTPEELEALLMRDLAANARPKSIPSVPQIQNGNLEQIPGQRTKRVLRPRHCELLQRELEMFMHSRQLSKSAIISMKQAETDSHATLSEGSLPRTSDGTQNLVTAAKATQFRRLIELILIRDREGLINMGRRVNIAGLLGTEFFDPDNLQFIELSNGLPMLAPRHRDLHFNIQRFGGLLGIPQMVAAGYLPPARELASAVETNLGPGTIRRVSNVGHNHYIYHVTPTDNLVTRPNPLLRPLRRTQRTVAPLSSLQLDITIDDITSNIPPTALQRLRNLTRSRRRQRETPQPANQQNPSIPNVHFWNDIRPTQLYRDTGSVRNPFFPPATNNGNTSVPSQQRRRLFGRQQRQRPRENRQNLNMSEEENTASTRLQSASQLASSSSRVTNTRIIHITESDNDDDVNNNRDI